MSVQSAKDFLQRIETDQALREQVEAAADPEVRRQIIHQAGFDFTMDEFTQAVNERVQAAGRELTPEELQQVAGGWCPLHWCPKLLCPYHNCSPKAV
ncbi:MAG: Nif11-like leader peptide family natural product precursor [Deltaproteobacteria bacterium]|nr:MAG: Nif11-like leader peptide family natural product precursor [Deltaproteobacteria bacterium]